MESLFSSFFVDMRPITSPDRRHFGSPHSLWMLGGVNGWKSRPVYTAWTRTRSLDCWSDTQRGCY